MHCLSVDARFCKELDQWWNMKKSIACTVCRASRRKCVHGGGPPCDRCKLRGDECVFPPKGTSSIHRRPRAERDGRQGSDGTTSSTLATPMASLAGNELLQPRREAGVEVDLWGKNPFDYMTDEVKHSYVRCSYKWSFHHLPTLFAAIHKQSLDTTLVWAMLAITVRFSQDAPAGFASQIQASQSFASHTRTLVLQSIDEPTLQRIQVLLMLTGHSWGAGEGRRAWIYLGMAVRMAQVMELFDEGAVQTASSGDFVAAEERRRTAWTCFLMDSLLSGGKGRTRLLSAEQMNIPLPCGPDDFVFGEPVTCERLDGSRAESAGPSSPLGGMGIVAYSMRVADIWGEVARWAYSSHATDVPPWQSHSEFQRLLARLNSWKESLPARFRYSEALLNAHTTLHQGQAYCYMHSIYFMSVMFLYRSYLPEVEMQSIRYEDSDWAQWSNWSSKELARVADQVCDMLREMRDFGLSFLRGLVPWIGFTSYTGVGTLLYFVHYPNAGDDMEQVELRRQRIIDGCMLLKDMSQSWSMANTWRETINGMHIFYSNVMSRGDESISQNTRRQMRNTIIDYGALQASPVQGSTYGPGSGENDTADVGRPAQAEAPGTDAQQGGANLLSLDGNIFDSNFDVTAAMQEYLADATQGFWADFPGSMEI